MTTGTYVRLGGGVLGAIVAIVFIKQHPIPLVLEAVAAGIWYVGDRLVKAGK